MNEKVIIVGAGGHGKVVAGTALAAGLEVYGIVDADKNRFGSEMLGIPVLGGDEVVLSLKPSEVRLLNGIGSVSRTTTRETVYNRFKDAGYLFLTVTHPSSWIDPDVQFGEVVQILAEDASEIRLWQIYYQTNLVS